MTETLQSMTCQEFQDQLPELIGSGLSIAEHPHYQSCELCRALLADLEAIAHAARQLFPIVEPPDDLWKQIELAIRLEEGTPHSN
jgi:hypothetical protein